METPLPRMVDHTGDLTKRRLQHMNDLHADQCLDLACCRVRRAGRFRCMASHTKTASSVQSCATSQALLRKLPGLPDDPCAVHHPTLGRNWQQTLLPG
jgi:hypothetical protein